MIKLLYPLAFIFVSMVSVNTAQNFSATELSINRHVDGTLLTPDGIEQPPLVIFIAGSGPTDRNGNQALVKNNMLKKLAESLSERGIATFRYDKRVVKQLRTRNLDKNIRFDDFVTDAKSVINHFKSTYSNLIVAGHSQGSLVGLLTEDAGANGFISLAGAANSIDQIILEQISKSAPFFTADTKRVLDLLKSGQTTTDFPPALSSIFNLDLQPFMSNWMQYNPKDLIKKLEIPVLIINGTKDLQVAITEAQQLKEAKEEAQLEIIENMNHLLFEINGDDLVNSKSYNDNSYVVMPQVIEIITAFIKKEKSTTKL